MRKDFSGRKCAIFMNHDFLGPSDKLYDRQRECSVIFFVEKVSNKKILHFISANYHSSSVQGQFKRS